jgi:single-strand DNA-binding protein
MNETMVTVVGNVATAPVFRELPSGSVARFRLAATARHRDRATGTWSDGHTNFFTVWAWRGLGTNVAASLSVGEPLIVQGKLKVRNEDRGQGQQWMSADIDAVVIGHDLSRGTAAFRRVARTDGAPGERQLGAAGADRSASAEAEGRSAEEESPPSREEQSAGAELHVEGQRPTGAEGRTESRRSPEDKKYMAAGERAAARERAVAGERTEWQRSAEAKEPGGRDRQDNPPGDPCVEPRSVPQDLALLSDGPRQPVKQRRSRAAVRTSRPAREPVPTT